MKVVVVKSKEKEGEGGQLVAYVPESELWAFQVLCARAEQKIVAIRDEKDTWKKEKKDAS